MKVIKGGRQTGKTYSMIQWLRDNEYGILVVDTEFAATRLRDRCDPDGIMGLRYRIVTTRSWLNRRPSFHAPSVAIDDVDLVLKSMFGNVEVVTMTGMEER